MPTLEKFEVSMLLHQIPCDVVEDSSNDLRGQRRIVGPTIYAIDSVVVELLRRV